MNRSDVPHKDNGTNENGQIIGGQTKPKNDQDERKTMTCNNNLTICVDAVDGGQPQNGGNDHEADMPKRVKSPSLSLHPAHPSLIKFEFDEEGEYYSSDGNSKG